MIRTETIQTKIQTIVEKINNAERILVISDSARVDEDCIYSGLTLRWLFQELGKEVDNVIFSKIADRFSQKPDVNLVESVFPEQIDFQQYDLIALVDSPKWSRILTNKSDEILLMNGKDKFISFDHHRPEDIEQDLGNQSLSVECSSTGLLIYETIFKELNITPDVTCAEYLYRTVISDTQCLRVNSNADTFLFCAEMQNLGVDHLMIVEEISEITKPTVDFFSYCLSKTEYIDNIKTTVLYMDQEFIDHANITFGTTWRIDELVNFYKENFMRRVEGYDHGLIFWIPYDQEKTKVSWRSKEFTNINLIEILESLGFTLGGHKNAGGGFLAQPIDVVRKEMESQFVN